MNDILEDLHEQLLKIRSIERTLNNQLFKRLYSDSTKEELLQLRNIIKQLDSKALDEWAENHSSIETGEKSIRVLQRMARERRIRNWSRLPKAVLITEITNHDQARNDRTDS